MPPLNDIVNWRCRSHDWTLNVIVSINCDSNYIDNNVAEPEAGHSGCTVRPTVASRRRLVSSPSLSGAVPPVFPVTDYFSAIVAFLFTQGTAGGLTGGDLAVGLVCSLRRRQALAARLHPGLRCGSAGATC